MLKERLQTAIRAVYPPRCLTCGGRVETDHALCGSCWRDAAFIVGHVCDLCGVPLPGAATSEADLCDACLNVPRPWARGRAALLYRGTGRSLVLALKHGDRHDIAVPAARWMAAAATPLLQPDTLIVPVPLHFTRLMKRLSNQSALIAQALGRGTGCEACPDALIRPTRTPSLDGRSRDDRFAILADAISAHPRRRALIAGRPVLLVDDVMTSGATLAAGTEALLDAGAGQVCIAVLARVAKDA